MSPMASRMSSLRVEDQPSQGSNSLQASGVTGGLEVLRSIVGGSVSTAQVVGSVPARSMGSRVAMGNSPDDAGTSSSLPGMTSRTKASSVASPIQAHPSPLEGGLHQDFALGTVPVLVPAEVSDRAEVSEQVTNRTSDNGYPGGDVRGDAPGGTQTSGQEDTFVSAQEMLSAQSILYDPAWRTQRWEHHRLQRCARFGLPSGPIVPLAERLDNMPPDTRTLPYGICRTSIGTWVTTTEGQSAFYPRRAREYEDWDLDEDQNIRPSFPRHPSFDDTVDEDDFFIDYVSCTSNFSFTAHPEDYEGCPIVPPTSISIRRHANNLVDDVQAAWPSEGSGERNSSPTDDIQLRNQKDTVMSMALTLDDILGHIMEIFARTRDLGARIVGARDEAECGILQVSGYVASSITSFQEAVQQDLQDIRKSFDAEIDTVSDDFHARVTELENRMDALERRMDLLPSTSPIPPLQAIRGSLTALERAATRRLSDHANSLMVSLTRRREPRSTTRDGGRSSGASGWSVASDSQLSVDAPADHGGLSPPLNLRGGGIPSYTGNKASPPDGARASSQSSNGLAPTLGVADPVGVIGDCGLGATASGGVPTSSIGPIVTGPRHPTPWANGNIFSARENAANAAQMGVTFQQVDREVPTRVPALTSPNEVVVDGQRYTRAFSEVESTHVLTPPPGLELGSSLLMSSAQRVSSLGKCWHGGGDARSFITGMEYMSPDQVVTLGVPSAMAFVVAAAHHQIYSQWCRVMERGGHSDRGLTYGVNGLRPQDAPGRSFGPNHHEAIKYTGWPELPRDGVTPERWIEFYTALQLMGNYFNIGIMPFDALDLKYSDGGHALCICGLGYTIFTKMGASLFLIVQKLLPLSVPEISTKVQSVAINGGNGFELLWVLTKHFVPMVSTTKHLGWPVWPSSDDPFLFARRVSLFCTLCRLRGMKAYTDSERSELFLSNVGGVHREYAQHLLTTLHVHASTSVDGSLPSHLKLQISDLTERLMDRLRDDSRGSMALTLNRVTVSSPSSATESSPNSSNDRAQHIQGYCVNIARVNKSTPRGAPVPKITAARRGKSSVRRDKFEGNCDACGKYGHQVVDCDALGMAICMRKYLPNRSNSQAMQVCEENWTEKNKKWITPTVPPRKLLTRYCESSGLSIDQVDEELDWDLLYSSPEDQLSDTGDESGLQCNRVEESTSTVEWFNIAPLSSAWFPQSFRVGLSPIVPTGSTMDDTLHAPIDMTGELHDPALRSVDDDESVELSSSEDSVESTPSTELEQAVIPSRSDSLLPPTPTSYYALLASLATDIRPVDIMHAFEYAPLDYEESEGGWGAVMANDDMCGWGDVLVDDLSILRESFQHASLEEPDLSQSLVVPDYVDMIVPSSSKCCRHPGLLLVDSGSNVCLTNDLSILENVQDMQPRALDVAVDQSSTSPPRLEMMCTKFGFISIRLLNGRIHRQKFLYNESASDTILSPEDIVRSSPLLHHWVQSGSGGPMGDGCLLFAGVDEVTVLLSLSLVKRNGLYYCILPGSAHAVLDVPRDDPRDDPAVDPDVGPISIRVNAVSRPVTPTEHLTSELWAARLGYCGTHQLSLISRNTTGTPAKFRCHPFRFIDVKEDAAIKKQPCGTTTTIAEHNGSEFMMDFSFLRASSGDYGATPPMSADDRIVQS